MTPHEAEAEEEPEVEAEEEAEAADEADEAEEVIIKAPPPAAALAEVEAAAGAPGEDSEFVSAVTATAATASLAAVTKAAMANRHADAIAIGGGRTLEELVRESLAPELKSWLDANLPELVERIVREEIRKMVRRAEDQ
jgi:cell pole-organizing protein PopZ